MRRAPLLLPLLLASCTLTVTTLGEDAHGNRFQCPPLWELHSTSAREMTVAPSGGNALVLLATAPPGTPCEALLGQSAARAAALLPGFRLTGPHIWREHSGRPADQYVAGAAYNSGVGTALCGITPAEIFVVILAARGGIWESQQPLIYRTANSYRRKATGEKPVFDMSPLEHLRPDGKLDPSRTGRD